MSEPIITWTERIALATESFHKWDTLPLGPRLDRVFKESGVRDLIAALAQAERERDEALRDWQMYQHEVDDERARAEAAERLAEQRGEALRKYGRHTRRCQCSTWEPEDEAEPICTCGLDAALADGGQQPCPDSSLLSWGAHLLADGGQQKEQA